MYKLKNWRKDNFLRQELKQPPSFSVFFHFDPLTFKLVINLDMKGYNKKIV